MKLKEQQKGLLQQLTLPSHQVRRMLNPIMGEPSQISTTRDQCWIQFQPLGMLIASTR